MAALRVIFVVLVSQEGIDVSFRKTSLTHSYGEWLEEMAREEAGQISEEKMATKQVVG